MPTGAGGQAPAAAPLLVPVPSAAHISDAPPRADTFTGRSLEEMTLAQKICELREDRLRVLGLEQGFWDNVRLVGLGFALKRARQKLQLRRRGELEVVIADYRRQVEDDIAAIERDEQAREVGGYRTPSLSADVARVIERFGREQDRNALADLRRYVKIHQTELAAEIRRLELDRVHPEPGVGRTLGKLRNLLADHRRPLVVGGAALLLGVVGWTVTYALVQSLNRNRPTFMLAAGIASDHPGVLAAAAGHDASMAANRLVNVYLSAEVGLGSSTLLALGGDLGERSDRARRLGLDAQGYYARGRPIGVRIARQGAGLFGGWSHTSEETGHTEETCTTSTNSDGEREEHCTSRYVCDYVDHEWRLEPEIVRVRAAELLDLAPEIDPVSPKWADVGTLKGQLRRHVESSPEYAAAEPSERLELLGRAEDWLRALPIAGNDQLLERLRYFRDGAEPGGAVRWIADHVGDRTLFPLVSTYRDHSCGPGVPPTGYSRSADVAAQAKELDAGQRALESALVGASDSCGELSRIVQHLSAGLRADASASDFDREVEQIGELAIRLQRALNPESDFVPLSKAWRVALPLLALVGLALLGALASWLILRAIENRRYMKRMVKRGIY
jgi:hypothetical protein